MGRGWIVQPLEKLQNLYALQDEFYVQYIFVCDTKDKAKALEKRILSRTNKLTDKRIAEQEFDDESKSKGRKSREYRFSAKKQDLKDLLKAELNDNIDLWRYAVVFDKNSWKIIPSTKKLANLQRPAATRTEKLSFADVDKPKTDIFIPGVAAPVPVKTARWCGLSTKETR